MVNGKRSVTAFVNGRKPGFSSGFLKHYRICRLTVHQSRRTKLLPVPKKAGHADIDQGTGVSRGGKTTKIHAVVDGLGNPGALSFTQGSVHDSKEAVSLLGKISLNGSTVLGDKAFGSREIRGCIASQGGTYCIPPQSDVKEPWEVDCARYKQRHLAECFFQKLKNFRHIATRYDKLLSRFAAFVYPACIIFC